MSNIFLHFLSDFPVLIKVNERELGLIENSNDTLSIEANGNQDLLLYVFPVADKSSFTSIPYLVKIQIEDNIPTCSNPFVEITDYEHTHFEIKFNPMQVQTHKKAVMIDNIQLQDDIIVSIFDDGIYNLEINTKNKLYKFPLSEKIFDYKFEYYIENETSFLVLEGKNIQNQCFLLVFSNFICNLEIVADSIEHTKTEITVLNYQNDIAKHGVVQKYKLDKNHFILSDEYTVFLDEKPHTPKDSKIIPWAFAEALNIGDINLARTFLEKGLNNTLNDELLNTFFGNYSEIKWNRYLNQPDTLCFIYDGNPRKTKTYRFEIINNKISNITELD